MISNLAFVLRNIFSKKRMKGKSMSGMNYYACLYMMSLLIVTPFAIAVEGPQMWAGLLVGKTLSPKSNQTFSGKFYNELLMLVQNKRNKFFKELDLKPCKIFDSKCLNSGG